MENKEVDMVNHPPHYARFKFEPIDVLQDWFPNNPLLWQVAKYIVRAEYKGNIVEDLKKARFYLDREIERQENASSIQPYCYFCNKKIADKDMNPTSLSLSIGRTVFAHKICFERGAKVQYVQS